MLGYRVPLMPLKEWVVQVENIHLDSSIFTPNFIYISNRIIGEYELFSDKEPEKAIKLEHLLSNSKDDNAANLRV
jgi:hypothetical protein